MWRAALAAHTTHAMDTPQVRCDHIPDEWRSVRTSRGGWKCTAKFLIENLTPTERDQLKRRKVKVPSSPSCKLAPSHEKRIRVELRKIRNVASAQRSRQWVKVRIDGLVAKERADALVIERLRDEVARLQAENLVLANDNAVFALSGGGMGGGEFDG